MQYQIKYNQPQPIQLIKYNKQPRVNKTANSNTKQPTNTKQIIKYSK